MSHYTLASGQRQVTVSVYCPSCRVKQTMDYRPLKLTAEALCCSDLCKDQYIAKLISAENAARAQHGLPLYGSWLYDCYDPSHGCLSWLLEYREDTEPLNRTIGRYRQYFAMIV